MNESSVGTSGPKLMLIGLLCLAAGIAGVAFAWFPAPPHSTDAPLEGWPARWFAAGGACFGICLMLLGLQVYRNSQPSNPRVLKWARRWIVLAFCCWSAWLVSLVAG